MLIGAGCAFVGTNASENMEALEGVLSLKITAVWERLLEVFGNATHYFKNGDVRHLFAMICGG